MNSFCELIKNARILNGLLLRHVAFEMEIDLALISKLERGERKPTRQQVLKFSNFYKINEEELLIAWISDRLVSEIQSEGFAEKVLLAAQEKINFRTKIG